VLADAGERRALFARTNGAPAELGCQQLSGPDRRQGRGSGVEQEGTGTARQDVLDAGGHFEPSRVHDLRLEVLETFDEALTKLRSIEARPSTAIISPP